MQRQRLEMYLVGKLKSTGSICHEHQHKTNVEIINKIVA